nr:MAG TPA: hypothetical protein [Inoviridae sp.]
MNLGKILSVFMGELRCEVAITQYISSINLKSREFFDVFNKTVRKEVAYGSYTNNNAGSFNRSIRSQRFFFWSQHWSNPINNWCTNSRRQIQSNKYQG